MISMKPEYALAILQDKKTLELRNWIPKDFIGWVNVYVSTAKPYLVYSDDYWYQYIDFRWTFLSGYSKKEAYETFEVFNGKVVFRFWFENYDEINILNKEELLKKSCVSEEKLKKYEKGYAWHIDKLEIFKYDGFYSDEYEPKTLEDFGLKKAPQKCAYVYVNKEEKK